MINRKAERCKNVQIYKIIENRILDVGEILPQGICQDGRSGPAVRYMEDLYIINSIVA